MERPPAVAQHQSAFGCRYPPAGRAAGEAAQTETRPAAPACFAGDDAAIAGAMACRAYPGGHGAVYRCIHPHYCCSVLCYFVTLTAGVYVPITCGVSDQLSFINRPPDAAAHWRDMALARGKHVQPRRFERRHR